MAFSADDARHMARALELAERGLFSTPPNPRVGCVLVRDGQVVGEGFHVRPGEAHAEVNAIDAAGEAARGATAYVTLEPCNHTGRTPPCVDALIAAGVARVIAAMPDPNPVASGGAERLRAAGIAVEFGLLADQSRALNPGFIARVTRGRPWMRMKIAASLDGRTALADGRSQWITGAEARLDGHCWRARADAILTGIGTVRDDDPQLNVRGVATDRQPARIVVDSRLEISPDARILAAGSGGPVLVAAAAGEPLRAQALRARGVDLVVLPDANGKVDLSALALELGRRGLGEVHVEAGTALNGSLLRAGLIDELLVYLAPSVIGDTALGMFRLPALASLEDSIRLEFTAVDRVGPDLRLLARVHPRLT
jgi:diaminohydroxyphosphoribosylaminopyrimidine deaminase/5-amino-6-(5-phosphoribosylamino)uracil reductase